MIVHSGRGHHFYFCTDVPLDQFSGLQQQLIAKLGTDPAVKDLPRVMRLPGTLHLKDPANPRLVKLLNEPGASVPRWQLSDLVSKLGLSLAAASETKSKQKPKNDPINLAGFENGPAAEFHGIGMDESLSDGLEANIEEVRCAVSAIPSSVIATEYEWMKLARGLAFEAAIFNRKQAEQYWEILDTKSQQADGYNLENNRDRWLRYMDESAITKNRSPFIPFSTWP